MLFPVRQYWSAVVFLSLRLFVLPATRLSEGASTAVSFMMVVWFGFDTLVLWSEGAPLLPCMAVSVARVSQCAVCLKV